MTYIKLLTALAGLALLTACAGGVAITNNTNITTPAGPCVTNPYGDDCTAPTPEQRVTFCRDASKTTDTKTDDCAPTVFSVCDANAFDTLCPDDAVKEEAFCRDTAKSTSTKANDCAPIVMTACTDDFFDTICDDIKEYEDKRTEFNNSCINEPGKTKEICDMEALDRTCGADPFATGCEAGYASERKTTCGNEITSTRCIPTVTLFCGTDSKVFDTTYCTAPAHVDKRIDLCLTGDTNRLCPGSAGITNTFCTANPFDPRAGCMADAYNMARQTACESGDKDRMECAPTVLRICDVPNGFRNDFCRGLQRYDDLNNMNPDPCLNGGCVEYADWLASFTGGDALPTTPDATTRKNQFLAATATGFASGATDGLMKAGNTPSAVEIVTVKFASTDTATGGAAFFDGGVYANGDRVGTDRFYYAGILAGTDLGAPITEIITAEANVKWTGQIRTVAEDSNGAYTANPTDGFGLDITFDGAKGTMKTSFARGPSFLYEIDGMFDENGIITGSVDYGPGDTTNGITTSHSTYSPGTLTGIIGQNGAVGAFHSGRVGVTSAFGFAGGFVVTPPDPCIALDTCVDTADWLASFTGNDALTTTPDATTRVNEFLQATATGFASGATNGLRKPITPPIAVEIGTVKFADADTATGGMAFFNGGVYNDSDERLGTGRFFYAGILAGTNLGAPITETITSVRWTGQIRADATESSAILSENPTAGFGVDITFDGAEGTIEETFVSTGSFVYSIDGDFDANGIITGTIEYGQVTAAGGDVRRNRHHFYSPGTLSGIIGQNGAVGVFHSDNDNSAAGSIAALFSGGFVVTPPK